MCASVCRSGWAARGGGSWEHRDPRLALLHFHFPSEQDLEQKMKVVENLQDDFDFNYKTLKSQGGKWVQRGRGAEGALCLCRLWGLSPGQSLSFALGFVLGFALGFGYGVSCVAPAGLGPGRPSYLSLPSAGTLSRGVSLQTCRT